MKKTIHLVIGCTIILSGYKAAENPKPADIDPKWELIFEDNFNAEGSFDNSKWSYSDRGNPSWMKYLTSSPEYVYQQDGYLHLRMDNQVIEGDDVPYHSAGIQTSGKFSFRYGKVEVRAKFNTGQGSWPAIWMMPEQSVYGGWPDSGEIDIMEHVNNETKMHHSIHNAVVTNADGGTSATYSASFDADEFNIYGIEWTASAIKFFVNKKLQYTYNKISGADSGSWPFDQPFYLILNQSGGLRWPGPITDADLPFLMQVDWVRVYQEKEAEK